jgi:hypothetical protein
MPIPFQLDTVRSAGLSAVMNKRESMTEASAECKNGGGG